MPVKLSDLDAEVKKIIKRVYQALLQASDRLEDVVDDDENYKLQNTLHDIEKLCKQYPWLRELAGHYLIGLVNFQSVVHSENFSLAKNYNNKDVSCSIYI